VNKIIVRPAKDSEIDPLGLADLRQLPGFRPAMVRLGVYRDRVVSRVAIRHRELVYGRTSIRTACLGHIYTEERYRNRGYGSVVLADTLAYMREQGAHLALVNDSTGAYMRRFGFGSVWPQYTLSFSSQHASQLNQPLELRPVRPDDLPHIAVLYGQLWGGRVTFSRDPKMWIAHVTNIGWDVYVAVGPDERPQGYIAIADPQAGLVEVLVGTSDAAMTIIAFAGRWYAESGLDTVTWATLPDDPLTTFAREWLELTINVTFKPHGAWMARLVDARTFIKAIIPELSAQAENVIPGFRAGALNIRPTPDHIEIDIYVAPAVHVTLSHRDFVQLMFGSISAQALGMRSGLDFHVVQLLENLFPPRVAALAPWDWF
jgi:GNAT superfamily N-acetyltransferase